MKDIISGLVLGAVLVFLLLGNHSSATVHLVEETYWDDPNETIILGYRINAFEQDKFARAACRNSALVSNAYDCDLQMELPRFSGDLLKYKMLLRSSIPNQMPILPKKISTVGSTIIFPWITKETYQDKLILSVINMTSRTELRDIEISVEKESEYKIVTFLDAFVIFYKDVDSNEVEDFKRIHKQTFYPNGTFMKDSINFFNALSSSNILNHKKKGQRTLDQLIPVSTELESSGYFFVLPRLLEENTRVTLLDPSGNILATADLGFWVLPDLILHNRNGIFAYHLITDENTNRTMYHMVIMNKELNIESEFNYRIQDGLSPLHFHLVDSDVFGVICEEKVKEAEKDVTKIPACYLQKIYSSGFHVSERIPLCEEPSYSPVIMSSVPGHICINIITHNNGRPAGMKTICVPETSFPTS